MAGKKTAFDQNIKVATDAAIFTVRSGILNVLLIQMKKKPFTGQWALPGGLIDDSETTLKAAERILREQTGVSGVFLEQLMTFDDPKRDSFGRVISVAWYALLPDTGVRLETSEKYAGVEWRPVNRVSGLAYDHDLILKTAIGRLRAKLSYTNVVWSLLPKKFTLTELQTIYEIILGTKLDKRNFRKKILNSGLLKDTGVKRTDGAYRPAVLYSFRTTKLVEVNLI
ncbi:MAG: NUDIX domain-containing protein [Patescibacteria group bacterium]